MPLGKLLHEVSPDPNQYRPVKSSPTTLPTISPLRIGKRATLPFIYKPQPQHEFLSTAKKTCQRRFVLTAGLIISIGLSLYISVNGSFQSDGLDDMENTLRYLTSNSKKDKMVSISESNNEIKPTDIHDITLISAKVKETEEKIILDMSITEPISSNSVRDSTKRADKTTEQNDKTSVGDEPERVIANSSDTEANSVSIGVTLNGYLSPYTTYHKNQTHAPKFAYAYVISGCNEDAAHRNYLYDISISTYVQREAGSTADVIVFIQMAFKSDLESLPDQDHLLMEAMDIHIRYIPKAEDESFYRTMIDKFLILGLTQYDRVLFMDGDVMARGNLDYLFDLSMKGVLKKNIVTAGNIEPANGGFFMLAPSEGARDRIMAIILDKERRGATLPYPHWDEEIGWGHRFGDNDYAEFVDGERKDKWDFYGAFADQGMAEDTVFACNDCRLEQNQIGTHTVMYFLNP
jgi:hypothetical protein